MADKLIGANYTTQDIVAKVTGQAKYAEDFRAEGMLFAKLLLSPMPHARVLNVDASEALAMEGVEAILTEADLPPVEGFQERGLTNEPVYEGEPILAVAAVDETVGAEAIEKIKVDYEPLPFVVDPLTSLRPNGPNANTAGNMWAGREIATIKWTEADFAAADPGQLPMGEAIDEWSIGDVAPADGNAQRDGVLAERQALPARFDPEHAAHRAAHRAVGRDRAVAGRTHRRVLWRRIRQQGRRRDQYVHPGAALEKNRQAGHDADLAARGALHRPSPGRVHNAGQGGVPRRR